MHPRRFPHVTSVTSRTRGLIGAALAFALGAAPLGAQSRRPAPEFAVAEATIPQMQAALREGRTTSRELVTRYLVRIATYEDRLNGVAWINARALQEADERDRERAAGRIRGPLHGIPVAVKDNIQTRDMPTTGGALAFAGFVPPYDATLVQNLRDAGAIILAKTTLTELANWVAPGMPANYSALFGYSYNPYDPRRDPRTQLDDGRPVLSTGGSSSGVGTAVSFWAANVGTETSGSILSPANQNMLVGIKPTVGRVSRRGVIPITGDQDTPGPMARTVADAAIMLGALEGARPDTADAATRTCARPPRGDYTAFLDSASLRGARIGVPRAFFFDRFTIPGDSVPRGGLTGERATLMQEAISILRARGAVIVDPADIPSVVAPDAQNSFLRWPVCAGVGDRDCSIAFQYGMKRDFNAWLRTLGQAAPVASLKQLREWNLAHRNGGALRYGQGLLDASDTVDVAVERARYEADRAKDVRLSATEGIDAVMERYRLDAILFPASSGAGIAARAGYPSIGVPFGFAPNGPASGFPEGFGALPTPFGVMFTGRACSEPRLIGIAYAFEQATRKRVPPPLFP
ncbi:MAG TPA: amidase family protein [Longimicrobium sp.]|uniref:amidase family protein n=1 Tax=Longimicrobium sp. TaxID=2029185 RepID=UPI002ED85207